MKYLVEQKSTIRQEMFEKSKRLTKLEKSTRSREICATILREIEQITKRIKLDNSGRKPVILSYKPFEYEPDINSLNKKLILDSYQVFIADWLDLSFYELDPEKNHHSEFQMIDIMLVPGIAFSKSGARIGHGKHGWYDRAMALSSKRCYKIGVCFREQILGNVPQEQHDQKVNQLIYA